MADSEFVAQTLKQKKITFANSPEMVEAAIAILREHMQVGALVGKSEYETVVNAVTMDAQASLVLKLINSIDAIRNGSLHQAP